MKNLQQKTSTTSSNDAFGIVAHRLMDNDSDISFTLRVDTEKKKVAIVGIFNVYGFSYLNDDDNDDNDRSTTVKFEWNFQE